MINIYKKLIINYIKNNLSKDTIKEYALNNNYIITDQESIIIYNFIKENYESILNGNDNKLLDLKPLIREDLYNRIIYLYNIYKKRYF